MEAPRSQAARRGGTAEFLGMVRSNIANAASSPRTANGNPRGKGIAGPRRMAFREGAVIVSVELPPPASEVGESPQVGNGTGPVTLQVRLIMSVKPPCGVNVTTSVTVAPPLVLNELDAAVIVKLGARPKVTDALVSEVILRKQPWLLGVPVQAPPQLCRSEPGSGVACTPPTSPDRTVTEQVEPQFTVPLSPLTVTVPEPLPDLVTVSVYVGSTARICDAALLAVAPSGSFPVMPILLVKDPRVFVVTTTVICTSLVSASEPMEQVTTELAAEQLPCEAVPDTNDTPLGSVSVNVTPLASCGPSFITSAV